MGLFRTALVVGVVIALMPTDRSQQSRMSDQVGDAAKWVFTYCDRNPATCTQAAEAWGVFVKKAEFAVKLGYEIAHEKLTRDDSGQRPSTTKSDRLEPKALERGTLTPLDLQPGWRGVVPARGGA